MVRGWKGLPLLISELEAEGAKGYDSVEIGLKIVWRGNISNMINAPVLQEKCAEYGKRIVSALATQL